MFSKEVSHPFFKALHKGLFGYSGKIDFLQEKQVEVTIKGRATSNIDFTVEELEYIKTNISQYLGAATDEAYAGYEVAKDAVASGDYDLESEGGELPSIEKPNEVWQHMQITTIAIEPGERYQIRLGFACPWDIEHDFGIYVTDRKYEYSGVSV